MALQPVFAWITAGAAAVVIIWRVFVWFYRIVEGIRCQLRTDMLTVYYKNKDAKEIRQYELQNFEKNFAAYTALGGNSFIMEIHKKVISWEVVS